jgi:hypothetical protein
VIAVLTRFVSQKSQFYNIKQHIGLAATRIRNSNGMTVSGGSRECMGDLEIIMGGNFGKNF